ncbi:MBL fold metallo-hydrolase [Agrococcus carbonis]|uniref:Glyoxylase, beta-lactamase superfamily II n=1 Tax=Agrococcus carbonis TaxID=684552 RepID=A0A1H1KVL9_9MICO|nr:MBL fold metallo-hydrolase [Agrococcus carbonis]SDR65729.1 Glyoxylase, beta-lactamase superfamily II [Agrococcus carbonis]
MLREIAEGVWVHTSAFIESNAVVVRGDRGALLVDPGITEDELVCIADDLGALGLPVVVGFATHPDWDHVLWHPRLGEAPRYGTARCVETMRAFLAQPDWRAQLAEALPPEHADEIPLALLGELTPLPRGAEQIPWAGPAVRVVEHRAHAPGHAALVIEHAGVLVAGDMLSDTLMPFLDLDAEHPLDEHLAALDRLEALAGGVRAVVPGHGSIGDAAALASRIALDRAYVEDLRDGRDSPDPRVGAAAPLDWIPEVHRFQVQRWRERTAS